MNRASRGLLGGWLLLGLLQAACSESPPPSPRDGTGAASSVDGTGGTVGPEPSGTGGDAGSLAELNYPTEFVLGDGSTLDCSAPDESTFFPCYAAMVCSRIESCCGSYGQAVSFASCHEQFVEWIGREPSWFDEFTLRRELVPACMQGLFDSFCEPALNDPESAACDEVIQPARATGQSCVDQFACQDEPPLEGRCRDKVCIQQESSRGAVGEFCVDFDCVQGAFCDAQTGTCALLGQAGQACAEDWHCDGERGLICVAGSCSLPLGEGETCRRSSECGTELFCEGASDAPADGSFSATCIPIGSVGAPCTDSSECRQGSCVDGSCDSPFADECEPFLAP